MTVLGEKLKHNNSMHIIEPQANMALNQAQALQDDKYLCKKHPDIQLQMICMKCKNEPVCHKCVSNSHRGHECIDAEVYIQEKHDELDEALEKTTAKLEDVDAEIGGLRIKEMKVQKECNNIEGRIGARQKQVKDFVDAVAGNLIKEVHEFHLDEVEVITQHGLKLRRIKDELEKRLLNYPQYLTCNDIEMVMKKHKALKKLLRRKVYTIRLQPRIEFPFNDRADTTIQLENIFGKLSTASKPGQDFDIKNSGERQIQEVTFVSEFSSGAPDVYAMSTSIGSDVWMSSVFSRQVRLMSDKGKLLKTLKVDFPICDVSCACEVDGPTIWLNCTNNTVKNFMTNDSLTYATTNSTPYSITATHNLIVGLRSGQLVKFAKFGSEILDVAECDRSGEKLVSLPHRIAESPTTGDIAIVNWDSNPNCIVVLDKDLNLKFRHYGKIVTFGVGEYKRPCEAGDPGFHSFFHPQDLCYDGDDNLVVADETCVFAMDSQSGKILGKILETDFKITSMTSDAAGNLWIGFANGKVKIVRCLIS